MHPSPDVKFLPQILLIFVLLAPFPVDVVKGNIYLKKTSQHYMHYFLSLYRLSQIFEWVARHIVFGRFLLYDDIFGCRPEEKQVGWICLHYYPSVLHHYIVGVGCQLVQYGQNLLTLAQRLKMRQLNTQKYPMNFSSRHLIAPRLRNRTLIPTRNQRRSHLPSPQSQNLRHLLNNLLQHISLQLILTILHNLIDLVVSPLLQSIERVDRYLIDSNTHFFQRNECVGLYGVHEDYGGEDEKNSNETTSGYVYNRIDLRYPPSIESQSIVAPHRLYKLCPHEILQRWKLIQIPHQIARITPISIPQIQNRKSPLLRTIHNINQNLADRCLIHRVYHREIISYQLVDGRVFVEPGVGRYQRQDYDQTHDHYDYVLLDALF